METKSTHTNHNRQRRYAPGTSRGRHNATTLLAQVADLERGQRIKTRREELHLTQPAVVDLMEARARELPETHDLHGKAPITLRGYQTYERGGGIVWEKAKLLAGILQMDVQAMMHGEEEERETPDLFAPANIEGELAGILQSIQDQLAEQTRVLDEIKAHAAASETMLAEQKQLKAETEAATRLLLAAVDDANRALLADAQQSATEPAQRAK
jgi:transcriptional regulator with XRE-family HTH domain